MQLFTCTALMRSREFVGGPFHTQAMVVCMSNSAFKASESSIREVCQNFGTQVASDSKRLGNVRTRQQLHYLYLALSCF